MDRENQKRKKLHERASEYAETVCMLKNDSVNMDKWELESLIEDAFEDGYEWHEEQF